MATMTVTEFAFPGHNTPTMANIPPVAVQSITYTSSSVASAAFNPDTYLIRIHVDTISWFDFGTAPTATVYTRMIAGQTEYFYVPRNKGYKVAVITGT